MSIDVQTLLPAVRASWSAETSIDPHWSPDNPALGQCAVTALVVQDHLGGDLVRAMVGDVSHYWNRLRGSDIDLTRDQFAVFEPERPVARSRDYVLSFPATRDRYELLRHRVQEALKS